MEANSMLFHVFQQDHLRSIFARENESDSHFLLIFIKHFLTFSLTSSMLLVEKFFKMFYFVSVSNERFKSNSVLWYWNRSVGFFHWYPFFLVIIFGITKLRKNVEFIPIPHNQWEEKTKKTDFRHVRSSFIWSGLFLRLSITCGL